MVTTRRTPGAAPRANNTTAPLPKVPKARLAASPALSVDDDARSGDGAKKGKQKMKGGKAHHKKQKKAKTWAGGLVDLVSRLALLWFTLYTLSVCPDDDALKSPICRGLYHYRELVLEPYVFPPLQRALAHPAVAPYVAAVRPTVERAVDVAAPAVLRARENFNTHVLPQWDKRVVPAYNQYVVPTYYDHVLPQWRKHVVPRWNQHVQPVYDAHLAPYVRQAEAALGPHYATAVFAYHTRVAPGAKVAGATLVRWQQQAQPYAILAANKLAEGYVAAKPYAAPAWAKAKELLAELLALLAVQRRKFVDPHVAQMWDRVVELSGSKVGPKIARAPAAVRASASSISSVASSASSAVSSAATSISKSASSAVSSASSVASSASSSIASSASSKATSASSVVVSKASSISSAAASSASSVSAKASAPVTESAIASASEVLPEVRETTSPNPHTTVTESVAATASSVSASVSSGAASVAGQASSYVSSAASSVSSAAAQVTDTVVSAASSLAAEAAKSTHSAKDAAESVAAAAADAAREAASSASMTASVAANHAASSASSVAAPAPIGAEDEDDEDLADFLSDLGFSEDHTPLEEDAIEETEAQSPAEPAPETEEERAARLERVADKRKAIMERHAQWEAKLADETKRQGREARKSLLTARKKAAAELKAHAEIRLAVDGLAAEADKLVKGAEGFLKNLGREGKPAAEKAALWGRIVDKVEDKFTKRVQEVETLVNGWYDGVNQHELNLVYGHTQQVLAITNAAQESLGLDYVWLDDVTYHDWQRYHELMREYERFMDKTLAVQNGTWAKPIKNVVQDAIEELETEVADVVAGFEARLTRLSRDGARAFAGADEAAAVPDVSVPVVPPAETAPGAAGVPPVLVGRGKEEVAEALGRVEAQEMTEALPPTTPDDAKSAEELVGEIADAAAGMPANVHVEL